MAQAIRRGGLFAAGDRVAVAVSGGSDSVALAWLLHDLAPRAPWRLTGLIHVNHGLRGADADGDEQFCRDLAARLGVPIDVTVARVPLDARARGQSLESAARVVRYDAFVRAAAQLDATVVVTGHTADDQAETVLLRLLRGASARGVAAIRARRGIYRRPLLAIRRAELRAYLAARGAGFRHDASNDDVSIPRNLLRRDLMPVIETIAPGGVRAIARFASLAEDDETCLDEQARDAIVSAAGGVQVDLAAFRRRPLAIARRIARQALEIAGGMPTFAQVEAIVRLARSDKPLGHLDLRGVRVEREGLRLRMVMAAGGGPAAVGRLERALSVPGVVEWPETSATIRASYQESVTPGLVGATAPSVALVQAESVVAPFLVRSRRDGDRFQPLGAPGSRKVQDLFVDRKIPRHQRDRVPVVVDARGRIVWVAGVALANDCRVTRPESGVVILELREGPP